MKVGARAETKSFGSTKLPWRHGGPLLSSSWHGNYRRLGRNFPNLNVLPPLSYSTYVERSNFFFVLKIWPASVGRRQIKDHLIKFPLSYSCPKSCTFHKLFLGPKIATEALLLTELKFHLKKNLHLDSLPVLKT